MRIEVCLFILGVLIAICIVPKSVEAYPIKTTPDIIIPSLEYSGNIAIADLNSDSLDDIIDTSDYANGYSAALYYQQESPPFSSPPNRTLSTGQDPSGTDIGDLNSDTLNDVVVAARISDRIHIYYQNPDYTINESADVTIATGSLPTDVEIADVNNDTLNDIVCTNEDDGKIVIHYQEANNTINKTVGLTLTTGGDPYFIDTGDLNDDGLMDIIAVRPGGKDGRIFYQRNDNLFNTSSDWTLTSIGTPYAVRIEDMNDDDLNDIVIGDLNSNNPLFLFYQKKDNTFSSTPDRTISINRGVIALEVGDIDLDGLNDIVALNTYDPHYGFIYFQKPDNSMPSSPDVTLTVGASPSSVGIGNLNNDSIMDIAITHKSSDDIRIYFGESILLNRTPKVEILSPNGGEILSQNASILWNGSDVNSDSVDYNIYLSTDGGSTWGDSIYNTTYIESPTNTTHSWDQFNTVNFSDSNTCLIKITADDHIKPTVEVISASYFTIDNNPPTTNHNYDGLWHSSDFQITLLASDAGVGVNDTFYMINGGPIKSVSTDGQPLFTLEGAENTLEFWSDDNIFNFEDHNLLTNIKLDKTKPSSSDDYDDLWHTSPFMINLTAFDDLSGIDEIYYRINGGPIDTVSVDGQPLITTEGAANTLEYWSVDRASNEEMHNMITDIKVDGMAPRIILQNPSNQSLIPAGTTLDFEIVEPFLNSTSYSLDILIYRELHSPYNISTVDWEDGNYTVYIRAVDQIGNSNTSWFFFILDSTPPEIRFDSNLNHSTVPAGRIIHLDIIDPHLSGTFHSLDGGDFEALAYPYIINTSGWDDGIHTIGVSAYDVVGNMASIFFEITVDAVSPYVISTNPSNNSEDIETSSIITTTFSEPMNVTNVGDYLTISPFVEFDTSWDVTKTVLSISFETNKPDYATTYNLTIDSRRSDISGNPMDEDFMLTFTTEKAPPDDWQLFGLSGAWILSLLIIAISIILVIILLGIKRKKAQESPDMQVHEIPSDMAQEDTPSETEVSPILAPSEELPPPEEGIS
ncbi:MAG: VCBS repeat-containing protein [Thermoplasmata archaeon]|nr:MAG: VCBS repeat-containing protein [Thermoplasmata archaeon]